MRNTIFTFIGVALLVGFVACDDWTSPEKLDVENEAVGTFTPNATPSSGPKKKKGIKRTKLPTKNTWRT